VPIFVDLFLLPPYNKVFQSIKKLIMDFPTSSSLQAPPLAVGIVILAVITPMVFLMDYIALVSLALAIGIIVAAGQFEKRYKPITHDPIHGDILTYTFFASVWLIVITLLLGLASSTLSGIIILCTTIVSSWYSWNKRYNKRNT